MILQLIILQYIYGCIGAIERDNLPTRRVKRQQNNVFRTYNTPGGGFCDLVLDIGGRVAGPGSSKERKDTEAIIKHYNPGEGGIRERQIG